MQDKRLNFNHLFCELGCNYINDIFATEGEQIVNARIGFFLNQMRQRGIDINCQFPTEQGHTTTLLHSASVLTGYENCIDYLIFLGADPILKDADNHTPLFCASEANNRFAVRALLENIKKLPEGQKRNEALKDVNNIIPKVKKRLNALRLSIDKQDKTQECGIDQTFLIGHYCTADMIYHLLIEARTVLKAKKHDRTPLHHATVEHSKQFNKVLDEINEKTQQEQKEEQQRLEEQTISLKETINKMESVTTQQHTKIQSLISK